MKIKLKKFKIKRNPKKIRRKKGREFRKRINRIA